MHCEPRLFYLSEGHHGVTQGRQLEQLTGRGLKGHIQRC
jgi:hypothetical protein